MCLAPVSVRFTRRTAHAGRLHANTVRGLGPQAGVIAGWLHAIAFAAGISSVARAHILYGPADGPGADVQTRLFSATVLVPVLLLCRSSCTAWRALDKAPQSSNELAGEFARSGMPASWLAPAWLAGRAIAVTL